MNVTNILRQLPVQTAKVLTSLFIISIKLGYLQNKAPLVCYNKCFLLIINC